MCRGNLLVIEQRHGVERQENDFSGQNKADIAENDIGRLRIQCARDNVKEKTLFWKMLKMESSDAHVVSVSVAW